MKPNPSLISTKTVREMAAAGAISRACLVGQGDGFSLVISCGMQERIVSAKRGHVKKFKSLNTAARFVLSLGLSDLEVRLASWNPTQRDF